MVKQVARLVEVDSQLLASPHELSGGQKQRVTMAGVMIDDIDILLFDEPLASLDPATGVKTMSLIEEIHQQTNKTIVIIEHRLEDVLSQKVDRIIVMNEGRIVGDLTPNQLLASPLLQDVMIREPLYISALKKAGCQIDESMNPECLKTMDLTSCVAPLKAWFDATPPSDNQAPSSVLLSFEQVSFGYSKTKQVLDQVSFEIHQGEMVSLVGQNGAGKSTISKLISGFYQPTSGRILFKGKDLSQSTIKERADKIGLVMQHPGQMISKTMVFDEVAFGLVARGVGQEEIVRRVHETLKICGLYPFRNWPISALSFGQKKRVSIAAILVLNPEMLILDEPTAGQDLKHYTEMMEFLKSLNERGMTILMITHDMHLMLEYTTRALVMANGRLIGDGPTYHVMSHPDLMEAAHLKQTSLYALAHRIGVDPEAFIYHFIRHEKGGR